MLGLIFSSPHRAHIFFSLEFFFLLSFVMMNNSDGRAWLFLWRDYVQLKSILSTFALIFNSYMHFCQQIDEVNVSVNRHWVRNGEWIIAIFVPEKKLFIFILFDSFFSLFVYQALSGDGLLGAKIRVLTLSNRKHRLSEYITQC